MFDEGQGYIIVVVNVTVFPDFSPLYFTAPGPAEREVYPINDNSSTIFHTAWPCVLEEVVFATHTAFNLLYQILVQFLSGKLQASVDMVLLR